MRPVTVQFLKNPDITHWGFEARWLGEDEWGDWIAVPVGTKRWKGPQVVTPTAQPAVFCAARDQWWHLHYNGRFAETYSHFVDIAMPAVWVTPNRYELVDLDLDVAVHTDGTIEIQDEDEFEIHQVAYDYTQEMIDGAKRATDWVVSELRARQEPFFDIADAWLSRMT